MGNRFRHRLVVPSNHYRRQPLGFQRRNGWGRRFLGGILQSDQPHYPGPLPHRNNRFGFLFQPLPGLLLLSRQGGWSQRRLANPTGLPGNLTGHPLPLDRCEVRHRG